jgi:hypothetical protein
MKLHRSHGWIFVLLLASCLEEKEPQVSFSFNSPRPGELIWNTTTVQFTAPASFTGHIDVRLGGQLIGSASNPPYQFQWNTREWQDGNYTLTAVATSADGSKQETLQEVTIRNNLLDMQVAANHIPSGIKAFIFLSDASGNTLAMEELKNNSHVVITGPESFNESTFNLSEVYLISPGYLQVYTISELPRGSWNLTSFDPDAPAIGAIEVKAETTPAHVYYVSSSGDSGFLHQEEADIFLSTNKTISQLFVREVGKPINNYTIFKNIKVGSSLTFPLQQVVTPMKSQRVSLSDPNLVSTRVKLYGFPRTEDHEENYSLGVYFRNGNEIAIEYPEKEFERLGSESYYRNKQIRMYSFQPDKMYDFKTLNAQIYVSTPDGRRLDLSTYGDFDMYMASWMFYSEQTGAYASWLFIGPPGRSQQLKLPTLPYEIVQNISLIKTNQLTFTGIIQVSDYAGINGYFDYRQYVSKFSIAGVYKFGFAWKEQLFTESGFTGGRTNKIEVPMLAEHLKIVQE